MLECDSTQVSIQFGLSMTEGVGRCLKQGDCRDPASRPSKQPRVEHCFAWPPARVILDTTPSLWFGPRLSPCHPSKPRTAENPAGLPSPLRRKPIARLRAETPTGQGPSIL